MKLGVNIDHIATIRQARLTPYPDLVSAVNIIEQAGADGITLHLREDRRHIQDNDLYALKPVIQSKMNLEMAATQEMVDIALELMPQDCCIVPEKREELTTEGGLDVVGNLEWIKDCCGRLRAAGIDVSLFIEPSREQIDAAIACDANVIEIHTGGYANDPCNETLLEQITSAVDYASERGLIVNAGHGLDYENVTAIAAIKTINELNIGHAIIARAIFVGLDAAVKEMKTLMGA
jgi:pyridoxine 5-phosphate synthase